jgi:hypothetical protein
MSSFAVPVERSVMLKSTFVTMIDGQCGTTCTLCVRFDGKPWIKATSMDVRLPRSLSDALLAKLAIPAMLSITVTVDSVSGSPFTV